MRSPTVLDECVRGDIMLTNSDLFDILLLRSGVAYHAAEVKRRELSVGGGDGAAIMASSPSGTEQYAQVRLLIGTWDTIASRVGSDDEDPLLEQFYKDNPVGHMWDALWPAIKIIRQKEFARPKKKSKSKKVKPKSKMLQSKYASRFQALNGAYRDWLDEQGADYKSNALAGINAQFG
jgi:hypothetical protein